MGTYPPKGLYLLYRTEEVFSGHEGLGVKQDMRLNHEGVTKVQFQTSRASCISSPMIPAYHGST